MTFLDRFHPAFRARYLALRPAKAKKIVTLLREKVRELDKARLLDVGCGQGHMTQVLGEAVRFAVGSTSTLPFRK